MLCSLGQVTEERVEDLSFAIWAEPKCQGSSCHCCIEGSLVELIWKKEFHFLGGIIILNVNFHCKFGNLRL